MGRFSRSNGRLRAAKQTAKADRLRDRADRKMRRGNVERGLELHVKAGRLERRAGW
jgi:hypothetical protein